MFTVKVTQYYHFSKEELLEKLDVANVLTTYTGRTGCMCGCNGKYYVTEESRAEAAADRGYDYEDDQVSPRAVTMAVNRMRNYIKQRSEDELQEAIDKGYLNIAADLQYIGTDIDGRNHSIYFNSKVRRKR